MARHKDANWNIAEQPDTANAQLTVLMDIRDELKQINRQLGCYRIPRALDAMHELGVKLRREKRNRRKRR